MATDNDVKEFQSLIGDPNFPKSLLKGEGAITRLQDEFTHSPIQFTRSVLAALNQERFGKWETKEGQEMLRKLNLSKEDILRWA